MKYAQRLLSLTLAGIVAVGMTASGCATPWFENKPKGPADIQPSAQTDTRSAAATYINSL